VKKILTVIQLAIIAGIVAYGTVCLYVGDFTGTYATLPFLIFYYVWFVAKRNRMRREESDKSGLSGQ